VFDDLCRASKAILTGGLTDKLTVAYECLERGKYKEAKQILCLDGIKSDINHLYQAKEKREQIEKSVVELKIQEGTEVNNKLRELREGAIVAQRLARNEKDWNEVEDYYETAMNVAIDFDLPKDVLFEYAQYLDEQRKTSKAIDVINKLHKFFDEISSTEKKAVFYQIAANLMFKNGDKLDEAIYCFRNAFSRWVELLDEPLNETQQLQLASLFRDVGEFWNGNNLNAKHGEDMFANAYAMRLETHKVMNKFFEKSNGKTASSQIWLLDRIWEDFKYNQELATKTNLEDNIHRLMASSSLLSYDAYTAAYLINEQVTISNNTDNRYKAYRNRAHILLNLGNQNLDNSNYYQDNRYVSNAILYYGMSMDDLIAISSCEAQTNEDLSVKSLIGLLHCNLSSAFRKNKFLGVISYEIPNVIAHIALTPETEGLVECSLEEEAHIKKYVEIFEKIYRLNPRKYLNHLTTAYLVCGEHKERNNSFNDAISDYCKAIELYKFLPKDIDANSGIYKTYIECELHLAGLYMLADVNSPTEAIPHYDIAVETCRDLSEKLPEVYSWKLVEIYTEKAKSHAALNEFEKAKELVFDKAYKILLEILTADHVRKFGIWDKWISTIDLFCGNIYNQCIEGNVDKNLFIDWANTSLTALYESYEHWISEIKKDRNLLLEASLRYVDRDGQDDYAIEYLETKHESVLYKLVHVIIKILMCFGQNEEAIEIVTKTMAIYEALTHIQTAGSGVLGYSIYSNLVCTNEFKKLSDTLRELDDGKLEAVKSEFFRIYSEISMKNGLPIVENEIIRSDSVTKFKNMVEVAKTNSNFENIYKLDIMSCFGHLGYVQYMNGDFLDAERSLLKKIDIIKSIEPLDLSNFIVYIGIKNVAYRELGDFYSDIGRISESFKAWTESLSVHLEFIAIYGLKMLNVRDSLRTQAGFMGSTTPIINARNVVDCLSQMGHNLPKLLEFGQEEGNELFNKAFAVAKELCALTPSTTKLALIRV